MIINLRPIALVSGMVLHNLAIFMYFPALLALFSRSIGVKAFMISIIITHGAAFAAQYLGRKPVVRITVREMFLTTAIVWLLTSIFAAMPFVILEHISFTDAYFEAMSGLTTTGSTVLSGLDNMLPAVLLWRSILHWLGGIGFIVMGMAILPFLDVGGMKLFRTESSDWSDKHTPKTRNVARQILQVYVTLTVACLLAYHYAGMTWFEAVNHAMATISTGGFSTSDASMAHFSPAAHWIACFFMFLGGIPFLLLVKAFKGWNWAVLWHDVQVRGFFLLIVVVATVMSSWLWYQGTFSLGDAIRISLFNIISIVTTTGFGLTDFSLWGDFTTVLFVFLFMTGACSGSTAGGFKIFRIQLAGRLFSQQLKKSLHNDGIFPLRYNGETVTNDIIQSVAAFALAFYASIVLLASLVALTGADPTTAISGALSAICNVGPGLGRMIGPSHNFAGLNDVAKWLLSFGMLLGRLEILTLAVVFTIPFWRGR